MGIYNFVLVAPVPSEVHEVSPCKPHGSYKLHNLPLNKRLLQHSPVLNLLGDVLVTPNACPRPQPPPSPGPRPRPGPVPRPPPDVPTPPQTPRRPIQKCGKLF